MSTGTTVGTTRYTVPGLTDFSDALLRAAGIDDDHAAAMTARMIDGDLLGHRTHGLAFLGTYLDRITGGHIGSAGELETLHDDRASVAWRANRLPGAWVMGEATRLVLDRVTDHAVVTVTIANCSHIGCLQSYLLPFTERGLLVTLTATNPGVASVAAPGGTRGVITTNPIAMGIPTRDDPILIDQCTSVGSNALFDAYAGRGERLPGQWLVDADGAPTDDPAVLRADPPGTIQSLGQADFGYKGFGFGLMSEALSIALPGYGRRSAPDRYGQGVFLQVLDPARFCGSEEFLDEIAHLVTSVRDDPGAAGSSVRLPGERALASRRDQLAHGVTLGPGTLAGLEPWARRHGTPLPAPV
ncbi:MULTISPECIES: Ldh family oxidoreductase [unclassified Pseudonocardia]|uniref:Ldh family oxidoreductase n=1 Tax=unclassified Pseudonocardia TaxID=2619320 RepID=UPI0001FFED57|nr:Ldh family oxidoreductase [Pseudonocardia sp. Ae707_Ps1]OLM17414.1 Malate dehydrogenase [Pseudonocardia sp. Ae707_Ps1]